MPKEEPSNKKELRAKFNKLIQGGEARDLMSKPEKLEEGKFYRPCRGPEKKSLTPS
jgi:hypothetical protein